MKNLNDLKTFFRISNASFNMVANVNAALGRNFESEMWEIHKEMLEELEKARPDEFKIDLLLEKMEQLAIRNSLPIPLKKFLVGGVFNKK